MADMNLTAKLVAIQRELKAPKGQYNSFAKYYYRSCEDITEAAKPICAKYGTALTLEDQICQIGERYYIMAMAVLRDSESSDVIRVPGWAREDETKKGYDASQLTGATSSYARKYALSGLFALDDTKDSDFTNTGEDKPKRSSPKVQTGPSEGESAQISYQCADCGKPFKSFTDKSGRVYDAATVWEMARERNIDGVARCKECREKAGTTKEG